jgi:hypothetical protein
MIVCYKVAIESPIQSPYEVGRFLQLFEPLLEPNGESFAAKLSELDAILGYFRGFQKHGNGVISFLSQGYFSNI